MTLEIDGQRLMEACMSHLLRTMTTMPHCQPAGRGVGSTAIEKAAGFGLALSGQDNWLTWSLLRRMAADDRIDMVRSGRVRYRLKSR
jgi:hypothetical protein